MNNTFSFINSASRPVELVVEPWAEVRTVFPLGRVDFNYTSPSEMSIELNDESACLSLMAMDIEIIQGEDITNYSMRGTVFEEYFK